jgi:hypothetical protein
MEHTKQGPFGEKIQTPVFDRIKAKQEIRQGLNDILPEIRHELGGFEKENPLSFVFQASIADGLDISRDLRLSPEEIQQLTLKGGYWFYQKHKEVFDKVISSLSNHLSRKSLKIIRDFIITYNAVCIVFW